jgi:Domain of unknown function (DUF4158)
LAVPVEFLSDQEAAAFGRYGGPVRQADLERFFFLDDGDRLLVAGQRGDHTRLGFSLQLATVRYIGKFLADPLEGCRPRSSTSWPVSCRSPTRRA